MQTFLRMKHWQLFLLWAVLPILAHLSSMFIMLMTGMVSFLLFPGVFLLLLLGSLMAILLWMRQIAVQADAALPQEQRAGTKMVRLAATYAVLYTVLIAVGSGWLLQWMSESDVAGGFPVPMWVSLGAMSLHLLWMASLVILTGQAARNLNKWELQRQVTVGDYIGDFFLLGFWPVGIWIIQPRLNMLAEKQSRGS